MFLLLLISQAWFILKNSVKKFGFSWSSIIINLSLCVALKHSTTSGKLTHFRICCKLILLPYLFKIFGEENGFARQKRSFPLGPITQNVIRTWFFSIFILAELFLLDARPSHTSSQVKMIFNNFSCFLFDSVNNFSHTSLFFMFKLENHTPIAPLVR